MKWFHKTRKIPVAAAMPKAQLIRPATATQTIHAPTQPKTAQKPVQRSVNLLHEPLVLPMPLV